MFTRLTNTIPKKSLYFDYLFALLPLSFIAGNTIINLNIILILLSTLFLYKFSIFQIKIYFLDKLIFCFFLIIVFSGLFNDIETLINNYDFSKWKGSFSTTIKSISFLRFLVLYFAIRYLYENKLLNLKYFFVSSCFFTVFVCFDIFIQFLFGTDIFGYEMTGRKLSGPFGDELVAGGYIQRFSLFSFFLLPLFLKNISKNKQIFVIIFLFIIFFSGIILSGNRMPLVIFLLSVFLVLVFQKETRKFFLPFIVFSFIFFSVILKINEKVSNNFDNFKDQFVYVVELVNGKYSNIENAPNYIKEFSTFYETWLMNKFIGGGIKNFRYNCNERPNISSTFNLDKRFKKRMVCNMHPHNYHLEILTELGVVGFIITSGFFCLLLFSVVKKRYFQKSSLNADFTIVPFLFLLMCEIFPIRSTGSFFTTTNATYIFLIVSIIIAILRLQKNKLK